MTDTERAQILLNVQAAFGLFFATLFSHTTTFAEGPDGYSGGVGLWGSG